MSQQENQTSPKALLAIGLCVVFYIGWNQYLSKKYPGWDEPPTPEQTSEVAKPADQGSEVQQSTSQDPVVAGEQIAQLSSEELRIETDTNVYQFDQLTGGVKSIVLKDYMDKKGDDAKPVRLTTGLSIQAQTQNTSIRINKGVYQARREARTVTFSRQEGDWEIEQAFTVAPKGSEMDVKIRFRNNGANPLPLVAAMLMRENIDFAGQVGGSFLPGADQARPSYIYSVADDTEWEDIEGHCNDTDVSVLSGAVNQPVSFFGFDSHYFISVLLPKSKQHSFSMYKDNISANACDVAIVSYEDWGTVAAGETVTIDYEGYFGPKVLDQLEAQNKLLGDTVDFGFFSFIAKPLLLAVQGFFNLTGNYGVAIIVMTLLLKLLFYPLMKASSTSMHKLKKLNPQMQEIREKHKDDKPRQQQEMMKFMTANKVNPMKGCFPILPQIPVFFAFWQVLRTSIDLRHAEFFGYINDLTAPDAYYITPILMGVAMFAQQKLTPTTGMDKTQEKIMMFIPIMFTVPMLTFPSGMTIYMLTNTLTSIAQQRWLYYKLDKQEASKAD